MNSSWHTLICGHNSLVCVCVVYVIFRLCVCLIEESSVTESNHSRDRDGRKARWLDVIWYVLALVLLQGYKWFVETRISGDDALLLLVRVLNVLRLIVMLLLSTIRLPLLFFSCLFPPPPPHPPLPRPILCMSVCVLCVWLCNCVCVWQRSQASLRATMAAQEYRMQVARQDNQM